MNRRFNESRKGGAAGWDDYDDYSLDSAQGGAVRMNASRKRGAAGRDDYDDYSLDSRSSRPVIQQCDPSLADVQRINMTDENQEQLEELLRQEKQYQYYDDNDKPVQKAESPAYESYDEQTAPEPVISLFAVGKLSRYGFDRERSKQTLESGGGEFGATLEQLLHQVFSESYGQKTVSTDDLEEVTMDECLRQRHEEALGLATIYGERFSERIANTVWTVSLDLSFLSDNVAGNGSRDGSRGGGGPVNVRGVCQFYLKGQSCRFGDKCKFKHQLPTKGRSGARSPDLMGPSQPGFSSYSPPAYELEIRFPKGNRYPFQAPMVAFSTTDESIAAAGRLNVTESLFGEALAAATISEPVVYALITVCEDETIMTERLAVSHHKYSTPPPVRLVRPPSLAIANSKSVRSRASEESRSSNHTTSRWTAPPNNQRPVDLKETAEADKLDEKDERDEDEAVPIESGSYASLRKRMVNKYNLKIDNPLKENDKLCREFQKKQSSRHYIAMLEQRRKLPTWKEKANILNLLDRCQVLVISGMTGCGKTTQIPQFILDASLNGPAEQVANILCTQPRRISAISVAQRVAQERAERLGHSVGYHIRLDCVRTSATRLLYCTTGVLLRRLVGEADLKGVTHVIVDEVHERTEESDFLLLVLRDLIQERPDLKVILMSATLDAKLFSKYFYGCPTIHIPGRTFPVARFFLEDAIDKAKYVIEDDSPYMRKGVKNYPLKAKRATKADPRDTSEKTPYEIFMSACRKDFEKYTDELLRLKELAIRYKGVGESALRTIAVMDQNQINMDLVESLLVWIVTGEHDYPPGAVLVFLPGLAEIKRLYKKLMTKDLFKSGYNSRCVVYPLHSSLSGEEQQRVFSRPPEGVTKIILSTNIAETSVTIDDVVYVIDSGKMKENNYDASTRTETLEESWVSRANALQRKGRAGRVARGVCFHLLTSHRFSRLAEHQEPEIKRVCLEQLCMRITNLDLFAEQTLGSVFSRLIEPPDMPNLGAAVANLRDLGALTENEKLTPLGYLLACLPVDVRIGKLMLFGAIFRCLDPALTIAASLAFKSPFMCPWEKREEANQKKMAFALDNSDHLTLLQAYKGWCSAAKDGNQASRDYCSLNFLSLRGLQEIASLKRQFAELLSDIGFIKEGLRAKIIERMSSIGTDGVLEATGPEANLYSENMQLTSAILCAALYPNVVELNAPKGSFTMTIKGEMRMKYKDKVFFLTKDGESVNVHPSSVISGVLQYKSPFLVFQEKLETKKVFIKDCSMVSIYALVLFGGRQVNIEVDKGGQSVLSLDDGWICITAATRHVAEMLKELRLQLDHLLEDKIRNPSMDLCSCPRGSSIIHMIVHLITTE